MSLKIWNNRNENETRKRTRSSLSPLSLFEAAIVLFWLSFSTTSAAGQTCGPEFAEFVKRYPNPLIRAIIQDRVGSVIGEIDRGAAVNASPGSPILENPILLATSMGRIEILKILIERKADVNTSGPIGDTPLMYACCMAKNLELVRLLLSAGADPNLVRNDIGLTVPLFAAQVSSFDILKELVAADGDIKLPDAGGVNALMASSDDEKIIRYLLSTGFDLEDTDDEGRTALHFAVLQEQPAKLRLLLEAGIKRDTKTKDGKSATDLAATIEDKEKRREILAILESGI